MNTTATWPDSAEALTLAVDIPLVLGKLMRRLSEENGHAEVTPSQASVLRRLEKDGPATSTALARAEGVRPQSMGATVAALEAAGLVTGATDPKDGRRTILSLTATAVEKFAAHRAARESWLFRAIQESLSPQQQHVLTESIALVGKLIAS